jgi:hypothetical protein
MDKKLLVSFIKKYYLDGKINESLWSAKNGTISTKLLSTDNGVVGEVTLLDGGPKDFTCDQIAIRESGDLLKLLSILEDEVDITLFPDNKKPKSLKFSDKFSKVQYALADPAVIAQVPTIRNAPDLYEVSIKLDESTKSRLLKSISSLPNTTAYFTLHCKKSSVEIIFGDPTINSNLINLDVSFNRTADIGKLDFSVTALKAVLAANTDVEGDPELLVSGDGLAKFECVTKDIKSIYYFPAKTDTDD